MIKNQMFLRKRRESYKMEEESKHILMKMGIPLDQPECGYLMKIFQDWL